MHKRIDIRRFLKKALVNNVDVGGRVFMSRPNPLFVAELPAQMVYFVAEPADHKNSGPRIYDRELMVHIDTVVGGELENVDDVLDRLAFETEVILLGNRTMDDLVHEVSIVDTRPVSLEFEGDNTYAAIRQIMMIEYETLNPINTNDITEWLKYNATWRLNNTADDVDDEVVIRTS